MPPAADVIVVGAGIAGCEAAWRTAGQGLSTLLITTSLDTVYQLAHDRVRLEPPPGTLMGELVSDCDPTDGVVGAAALHRAAKARLESLPALHLLQSTVSGLLVESSSAIGVTTWEGIDRRGRQVALCVGSFLRARLRVGSVIEQQGRLSEMAYDDLYADLSERGFEFVDVELRAEGIAGSLPYSVSSVAFAAGEAAGEAAGTAFELSATERSGAFELSVAERSGALALSVAERSGALARLRGLWAAGACAPRTGLRGDLPADRRSAALPGYEAAASEGRDLGSALLTAAGRPAAD